MVWDLNMLEREKGEKEVKSKRKEKVLIAPEEKLKICVKKTAKKGKDTREDKRHNKTRTERNITFRKTKKVW